MLYAFVIAIVVGCAAALMNEGVFSAATILVSTVIAGLVAFNYYEPVAGLLEGAASFLIGYGDIIAMLGIFSIVVTVLRLITEQLAPEMVEFPDMVHRGGGLVVGGITGWIMAGILLCAVQTLPLHQEFLGYKFRDLEHGNAWNPDRRWLAFVHRVSGKVMEKSPAMLFDPAADFAVRYNFYRRTNDEGMSQQSAAATTTPDAGAGGGRRPTSSRGRRGG